MGNSYKPHRGDLGAARTTLRSVFGFDDFRPGQAAIIEKVLAGADVLAIMPTGSGKSLCYQLPALLRERLTVVVSPLIALMHNQVTQLRSRGIAAATLNSANDYTQSRETVERLDAGALDERERTGLRQPLGRHVEETQRAGVQPLDGLAALLIVVR